MEVIGIDLDRGANQTEKSFLTFVNHAVRRAQIHGILVKSRQTKRGWHLKILVPNRKAAFWNSIAIRYHVGDDPRRMFYDIMRHRSGGKMTDTLFDVKDMGVPVGE